MKRPSETTFEAQATLVANYADLRSDRAGEILAQLSTPLEFLRSIAFVEPDRTPYTVELLGMALWMANYVEMRLKFALACKRPIEWSPQIQPMIWTPTHGSLPSGHATEAFCMALVLWNIIKQENTQPYPRPEWGQMMMRQAARIAINRTVAGVHFPVDSGAGALLGLTLGDYLVRRCKAATIDEGWFFDGTAYPASEDFDWRDYFDPDTTPATPDTASPVILDTASWVSKVALPNVADTPSKPLEWLWTKAKDEWTDIT